MDDTDRIRWWEHAASRMFGLEVVETSEGGARLAGLCHERFSNGTMESLHGGTYGGYAACAAEVAAASVLELGTMVTFLEFKVQIFRPLPVGATVRCDARVLNRTKRYVAVLVDVVNDGDGRLCSHLTSTFAITPLPGRLSPPAPVETPSAAAIDPTRPRSFQTFGATILPTEGTIGRVSAAFDPAFAGADGAAHPAFVAAIADSASVPACQAVKAEDESFTTLEYKVNFFRPLWRGAMLAEGSVVHKDHHAFVVDTAVTDAGGEVISRMLTTLALRKGTPFPFQRKTE